MDMNLAGRNILIIQGSLIAGAELKDAFARSGAQVYITGNLISAFHLLERKAFHGAVVDQGLHNEAFGVCAELQARCIPYICCNLPHRLQGLSARRADADHAVWKLASVICCADGSVAFDVRDNGIPTEMRPT
jgi:hypothetical protein